MKRSRHFPAQALLIAIALPFLTESGTLRAGEAEPLPPSFVGDVLPVLAKAGCASSGCHSSPGGQNGLKLSVFSYDPASDYESIVREGHGRRVFPAAPERSLVLLKPTQQAPHEGGERFSVGSKPYETLREWIARGMVYRRTDEPALERIALDTPERAVARGERGDLRVSAHFSDGSARDVTELADFKSSDAGFVDVDGAGRFTVGSMTGEGAIIVRYMGEVAVARMTLAPERLMPADAYASLPRNNLIDDHAIARWARLGLFPSEPCGDSEFIRRASLDLTGTLPAPERVRSFLADGSADKRERLVDALLEDPAWADRWALVWADLLRPNPDRVGVKSVYVLDQWLRESFRLNKPFDQFAREILTVTGSTHRDGPAVIFRDRREPADLTTSMSQVFLGVRLECAKCHHHPNERWSQDDFYHLAAYFAEVGRKGTGISPPISGSPEFVFHAPGGKVTHPVTGAVMPPKPPGGPAPEIQSGRDPRAALADWLVAPDNPFFARAAVNRVWGTMLGTGIVNPLDDLRTSNPPSNPELLDALARDFAENGFDLKKLMRRIATSRVYQLSSLPNESNVGDTGNFSRAYRRRLPAEVMTDAVADVTGVPDHFEGMPSDARALRTWNFKLASNTLDAFGRPDSSEDCPCERNPGTSLVQALHLMNSDHLQAKLAHKDGRIARLLAAEANDARVIDDLYLAALARLPEDDERALALAEFTRPGATRQSAAEDILWALVNSAAFVFNH